MARRASKVDENHQEIVEALRAIGASVQSLAAVGNGCPDILCGYRGANILLEIKMPGKTFTPMQGPWHRSWNGTAHVVRSVTEAIQVVTHWGRVHAEAQARSVVSKAWPALA